MHKSPKLAFCTIQGMGRMIWVTNSCTLWFLGKPAIVNKETISIIIFILFGL